MTLPVLNTEGIDISNTLAKISSMKHQDMLNQNMESEIEHRNALEAIASRKAKIEEDKSLRELALAKGKDATRALLWNKDHPDPLNAYDKIKAEYPEMPDKSLFIKQDKEGKYIWDKETYNTFANGARDAIELAQNPEEGKDVTSTIANPNFMKDQPVSAFNPRMIKVRLVVRNNKLVQDKDFPIEPVVDSIEKDITSTKHQVAMEKHAITMEGIQSRKESRISSGEQSNWKTIAASEDGTRSLQENKAGEQRWVDVPKTAEGEVPKVVGKPATRKEPTMAEKMIAESKKKKLAKKLTDDGTYMRVLVKEGKPLMGTKDGKNWEEVK